MPPEFFGEVLESPSGELKRGRPMITPNAARLAFIAGAALVVSLFTACGGSDSSSTPTPPPPTAPALAAGATAALSPTPAPPSTDSSGEWTGTWMRDASTSNGEMTVHLQQDGAKLTGDVVMVDSICLPNSKPLTGSIDSGNITFKVDDGATKIEYTGTAESDYLHGTMSVACSAGAATGTWQVSK
jgi:hypothetical protein